GSDQRGTIFGAYELSKQIGVSPWYWWDDIPPRRQSALYVLPGPHSQGEPAVKFRGFFINDENPTTGRWATKKFGPGKAVVPKPTCDSTGKCSTTNISYPGGLTHEYWEKVFEVALRMKANYVWPAVWGRQFADDDPENLPTARDYGIVVGTSHEAPMMRGIEEWKIRVDATTRDSSGNVTHQGTDPWGGNGEWAWTRNPESLKKYWREGIQRMTDIGFDGVVTLAMRGTGDVAADETGKIDVLSQVLDAQRQIITEVTNKPITSTPQVWLLYKEVQTYWDKGMRPKGDDVTVIWCDDNWGNMRKLQDAAEPERGGGYGIYYHFDYVGAGRNYKWIDTNLLPNIWEQLNLVYKYKVDRLWVVNVGDMKNEEMPLQFFLDYAWNPERWPTEKLGAWEEQWAEQQFGSAHAKDIANILHEYEKLQSDRKPELTNRKITLVDPTKDFATVLAEATAKNAADPKVSIASEVGKQIRNSDEAYFAKDASGTLLPPEQRTYYDDNPFSLTAYRELETVVAKWNKLAADTESVKTALLAESPTLADAYYQLVEYQVDASANLYELRLAQFKNILYAAQGRAATNDLAKAAEDRLASDKAMSDYYNNTLARGKWSGWQTQPKIGYGDQDRYGSNAPWQQPELKDEAIEDALFPLVKRLDVSTLPAALGVAVEGSDTAVTTGAASALPTFSPYQTQAAQYLELFNRGTGSVAFEVKAPAWLTVKLTPNVTTLDETNKQVRAEFAVADWAVVPAGVTADTVTIAAPNGGAVVVTVPVKLERPAIPAGFAGFVESNGYVSVEAEHFSKAVPDASTAGAAISWLRIPDICRTGSGLTPMPVDAPAQIPAATGNTPHLEYQVYLANGAASQPITVWAYLSPRNNVRRSAAGGKTISGVGDGLRYAVSVDNGEPQTVDINVGCDDINLNNPWAWHTSDNVNRTATKHTVSGPGVHTVKFWMVDPTVVVQKLVVDTGTGELRESYFGPPESYQKK
ncbi:MAG: glycosyl hydrolase 115 family protein, partial [Myxococcales bacterium]